MDNTGCGAGELYALRVLGDMMEPEFEHGVVIVVDPGGVIETGKFVVAKHGEEFYFRQLERDGDKYLLKCLNHAYDEVVELTGVEAIQGVVVQKAGRRRKERKHYV